MFQQFLVAIAGLAGIAAASNNTIGSNGYQNFTTEAFVLELDKATQVATALTSLPGVNAGDAPFNFLLPTPGRTDDGNYFLGDIQIRMRPQDTDAWTDVSSHYARHNISIFPASGRVIASADITASLGHNLSVIVQRTWTQAEESIIMTFNITNIGEPLLEIGGVGLPMPYNDNWVGKDQVTTWTECVVSDPAISLDAGYVITNRLTGEGPTLITAPSGKTPLEQYRLNYNTQPGYPPQWLDKVPIDTTYEGIFSWWMATHGLSNLDRAEAEEMGFSRGDDYNTPTNFFLESGESRQIGLRFFTAAGPRQVEDRLSEFDRPTIIGAPGFVVSPDDQVKLVINSSSRPSISDVSPSSIMFDAVRVIGDGSYCIDGAVEQGSFGQTRVTIAFENGDFGTAHYSVISSHATQLDNLGSFRFSKQWYNNTDDYFRRAPSIITYDNEKKQQVTDDPRAWVAGLSDEAGSGSYVSAAAKQLGRPNKEEVSMLETFAKETLFGKLQMSTPGPNYGGVRKSLFYYDPELQGVYDQGIDHSTTWTKSEAEKLSRSYNYPHPTVVYWVLYRLARNNEGLTTGPWTWYLDRAYDTIMGMENLAGIGGDGYSEFGLMEGTYFQMVLLDLIREGTTNSTLAARAEDVKAFNKQRADLWNSEKYPYASEFPWDNTGQEEVYAWTKFFGYDDQARATIETLMAIMPSVPHWGYSGSGRDLWDALYSAQTGPGARIERLFHHYKGSQSALPLVTQFQTYPTDIKMLRAGYGGVVGPLTSIGADGFGSTAFHTRPDYLAWDPLSGDNGVNIALHALSTRAIVVNDASLGGWSGFGATVKCAANVVTITPIDSFRQRLFIAENALYMELDAGHFASVLYDTQTGSVKVTFDVDDCYTPNARIRWTTSASTPSSHNYTLRGNYTVERGCSVIPLTRDGPVTITFG